jgi:hypothetical protein
MSREFVGAQHDTNISFFLVSPNRAADRLYTGISMTKSFT